jgi:O-antigen ligase
MTTESQLPPEGRRRIPVRLLPAALLLIVLIFYPPESHGVALAGCAALISLIALIGWSQARGSRGLLLMGAVLAVPLVWTAAAPGVGAPAVSLLVLAAAVGLGMSGTVNGGAVGRWLAVILALCAGGVSLLALYQRLWGLERLAAEVAANPNLPDHADIMTILASGRAFATLSTPAALGGLLALAIPATAGLALDHVGRKRALLWALTVLQLVGLGLTVSATAGAALLVALGLMSLRLLRVPKMLLVALLVAALLVLGIFMTRGEQLISLSDPAGSLKLRAANFRVALAMAGDHPWTGVGPGGFGEVYPAYLKPGDNETRHVHNLPLELLAEYGWILGMLLTLLFFLLFLGPVFRRAGTMPYWKQGLATGLAAFAIHNLADFTAFMPSLLWLAALLRGTLVKENDGSSGVVDPWSRCAAGAGLTLVLIAAWISGSSGLCRDQRIASRTAAFEGDTASATTSADAAVRLAPWDVEAAMSQARATLVAGERLEALEQVDRAVLLSPVRASARELRARILLAVGDYPGAYAEMTEAVRRHPANQDYVRDLQLLRQKIEELKPERGGSDE